MRLVFVSTHHHIDWLDMIASAAKAKRFAKMLPCSESEARSVFGVAGWEKDGDLGVIWLPPMVFEDGENEGELLWHLKQSNNGTSWLLARRPFVLPGLREDWRPIEL